VPGAGQQVQEQQNAQQNHHDPKARQHHNRHQRADRVPLRFAGIAGRFRRIPLSLVQRRQRRIFPPADIGQMGNGIGGGLGLMGRQCAACKDSLPQAALARIARFVRGGQAGRQARGERVQGRKAMAVCERRDRPLRQQGAQQDDPAGRAGRAAFAQQGFRGFQGGAQGSHVRVYHGSRRSCRECGRHKRALGLQVGLNQVLHGVAV